MGTRRIQHNVDRRTLYRSTSLTAGAGTNPGLTCRGLDQDFVDRGTEVSLITVLLDSRPTHNPGAGHLSWPVPSIMPPGQASALRHWGRRGKGPRRRQPVRARPSLRFLDRAPARESSALAKACP